MSAVEPCALEERPALPLTRLAIPTHGRPSALLRCIRSFAANASTHGRSLCVFVADSSPDGDDPGYRRALVALGRDGGTAIALCGPRRVAEYASRLALATDVPPDVVRFALLGGDWQGERIGANRNVILLQTAGERVLCADDDTACVTLHSPVDPDDALVLGGEMAIADSWFFADRQAALRQARPAAVDVFAAHDALIGWPLAGILTEARRVGRSVRLESPCAHLTTDVARGTGHVAATMNGVVGDSGMYSGELLLVSEGAATRERLVRSSDAYHVARASREVIRQAPATTVCHGGHCMSTHLGLDNRRPLVPFMPSYRSEDRVFGALLASCDDRAYYAHVPVALVHAPAGQRTYVRDPYASIRISDIIVALLAAWRTRLRPTAPSARLRSAASLFCDLGALPTADLIVVVTEALVQCVHENVAHKERLLRRFYEEPSFWAADLRRQMDTSLAALCRPGYCVPADLRPAGGGDPSPEALQAFLRQFGQLLAAWPTLVDGAVELRNGGYEVGQVPMDR